MNRETALKQLGSCCEVGYCRPLTRMCVALLYQSRWRRAEVTWSRCWSWRQTCWWCWWLSSIHQVAPLTATSWTVLSSLQWRWPPPPSQPLSDWITMVLSSLSNIPLNVENTHSISHQSLQRHFSPPSRPWTTNELTLTYDLYRVKMNQLAKYPGHKTFTCKLF